MTRPLATDGWTSQDDARAARIQVKRTRQGVVIQEDALWQTEETPFITAGVDVQRVAETRVYQVRPGADGASREIIGFPFVDEGT